MELKRERKYLLQMALEKLPLLPFALVVEKWRYGVFRGEITPENYNTKWWELRYSWHIFTCIFLNKNCCILIEFHWNLNLINTWKMWALKVLLDFALYPVCRPLNSLQQWWNRGRFGEKPLIWTRFRSSSYQLCCVDRKYQLVISVLVKRKFLQHFN